jgi:hypothetical protein
MNEGQKGASSVSASPDPEVTPEGEAARLHSKFRRVVNAL